MMCRPMDGVLLVDKPAGKTSHDVVAAVRRALRRAAQVGHAGTLDPFATGLLLVLVGRATRVQRFLMALPKTYETVARLRRGLDHRRPRGRDRRDRRGCPPEPLELPTGELRQRPPAYSAVKVGGERAYERARAGRGRRAARARGRRSTASSSSGARATAPASRSSAPRAPTCASLIADLGDAYCEELRRTAIGPFEVADADPRARSSPLAEALARSCPRVRARRRDDGPRAPGYGQAVEAPRPGRRRARACSSTHDGPIAIAEPPGRRGLKPVVGFRA